MSSISAGTTSTTTLVHSGDTTGSLVFKTNDTGSGGTTAVTIDTSQNVTCVGNITLNNGAADGAQLTLASSGYSNWNIDNYSGNLRAYYNATEYMRIDSSGNLLVGTTSVNSGKLNVVYTGTYGVYVGGASGASTQMIFFSGATNTGSISSNGSNTAFNTSSDYRLKENIAPMTGCLSKVQALKPVTYRWKESGLESQGFIAHELAEVCPEAVTGAKDAVDANGNPIYQGIDTSFLVATLTAAIQELKAINDQQAETINALTARVVALESK